MKSSFDVNMTTVKQSDTYSTPTASEVKYFSNAQLDGNCVEEMC